MLKMTDFLTEFYCF